MSDDNNDGHPENIIKWIAGAAALAVLCFVLAAALSGWNPFA